MLQALFSMAWRGKAADGPVWHGEETRLRSGRNGGGDGNDAPGSRGAA